MRFLRKLLATRLGVMDGHVVCPRRGDIDVDVCVTCPSLVMAEADEQGNVRILCDVDLVQQSRDNLYLPGGL